MSGASFVQARRALAERLAGAGIEAAEAEARFLVEAAAGGRGSGGGVLTPQAAARLEAMTVRRLAREPLAYILGSQPFWTLDLAVTPDVLVPRADTEAVVEAALALLPDRTAALSIVDFGTGSGAILLALMSELPKATGLGVDASEAALAVARENAARHGLADRCDWRFGDWAEGLADAAFDLAVSNPPYIAQAVIEGLEPEVRGFEPRAALDGGMDGLDAYRVLTPQIFRVLKPGGIMALEIGFDQDDAVCALAEAAGFETVAMRRDLGGNPRVVTGKKPQAPRG